MTKGSGDICDDQILELLTTTGKILLNVLGHYRSSTYSDDLAFALKYTLYVVFGLLTKQFILYY